jgi:hypothetical protein
MITIERIPSAGAPAATSTYKAVIPVKIPSHFVGEIVKFLEIPAVLNL